MAIKTYKPMTNGQRGKSTLVNTEIIRKLNNLTANMEKVLVVWIENQANHNISLS